MSAPIKRVLFTAALFLFSLILAFGLAEIILRTKNSSMKNYDMEMWKYARVLKEPSPNPLLGHEHRPSSSAVLQGVEIRINEDGLRGGPTPPPRPGERRILFLGSSVTLGWGVPEPQIMTSLLMDMFRRDGQEQVVVFNAGIGNYNTLRYVERFLTRLTHLKPTDIVVHYFLRDAEALESGGGNFLLRHSQFAVTVWVALGRLFGSVGEASLLDHYQKVYRPEAPGFKDMEASLQKLSAYAKANHIRLYLAMTPDVHNLTNYPFTFIHERIKGLAEKYGYRYIDLLPAFVNLNPSEIWAMPGDPHPNALGQKLMAERIYPVLKEIN